MRLQALRDWRQRGAGKRRSLEARAVVFAAIQRSESAAPRRECNCRRWFHRRDRASLRGRAGGGPTRWAARKKSSPAG